MIPLVIVLFQQVSNRGQVIFIVDISRYGIMIDHHKLVSELDLRLLVLLDVPLNLPDSLLSEPYEELPDLSVDHKLLF